MSLAPTYGCFGCVDFANNARTKKYVEWACRTGRYNGDAPPMNWLCACPDDDPLGPPVQLGSMVVNEIQDGVNPTTPEMQELVIPPGTTGTFTLSLNFGGDDYVTAPLDAATVTATDIVNAANAAGWWVAPSVTEGPAGTFTMMWGPSGGNFATVIVDDTNAVYATLPGDPIEWTNPIDDQVCWYDPLIPESADFLGVVIYGSSNIRSSSFKREISDGLNGGSILGQPIVTGKQLMLEVWLYATSQAGMNYGIQWLRRQFEGDLRCPADGGTCASCQGQLLTLRTHCPEEGALDDGLHSWSSAGTIDGFQPNDDEFPMGRRNCEKITTGTITIATEEFSSYSTNPVSSVAVDAANTFTALGNCLIESRLPTLDDVCCPICQTGCDPCTTDPGCDCLPPFILEPETVGYLAPCFTDPLCRCIAAVAIENLPAGYETALRMTFSSGWDPSNPIFQKFGMRNFVFRVYENPSVDGYPTGLPLPTDLESYEFLTSRLGPCAEVGVSWMPPGSELIIDGLSGRSWLKCNQKCVDHSSRVETISGSVFPLKARCTNLVVTVEWDCLNVQSREAAETIVSSMLVETFLGFNL